MAKLKSKEYGVHQLLNPEFRYVNSSATDIRETFRKVRERIEAENKKQKTVVVAKFAR